MTTALKYNNVCQLVIIKYHRKLQKLCEPYSYCLLLCSQPCQPKCHTLRKDLEKGAKDALSIIIPHSKACKATTAVPNSAQFCGISSKK